jgi:hypothetical protein
MMKPLVFAATLLSCVGLISGLVAAAASPTAEAASATRPANAIITGGIDADGMIHVVAHKAVTLTAARPYKRLQIAAPDLASIDPIGPTQILLTGHKAGETSITIWDEQDVSQTVDVRVSASPGDIAEAKVAAEARQKWDVAAAVPPLHDSKVPGFLRFDLSKVSIDLPLSQITAIVTEGEGETSTTRIVFAANSSKDFPRELKIPAKVQSNEEIFAVLARAAVAKAKS